MRKLIFLLLFLTPTLSWAVASVRQEAATAFVATAATTVTTPALGSAALVGDMEEAWAICSCTTAPSSVVDSASQTYTLRTSINDNNTGITIYLYTHANNSSATALTVTITWASAQTYNGAWLRDITGVTSSAYQTSGGQDQGPPGASPGTGVGAISSGNVTPTSQPCLLSVISWDSGGNASSVVAGSLVTGTTGWLLSGATAATTTSASMRLTSTSAVAATFTNTTDGGSRNFITIAAIYTEASTSVPGRGFFIGS